MALSTSGLHYCPGLQADFRAISTPICTHLCRKKCLPIYAPSAHRSWKKWLWKVFLSSTCPLGLQWFIDGLGCSRGRSPTLAPVQLLRIFLEVFPVLVGGSGAGGRKAGSSHLQQWRILRVSALPELMSCTAAEGQAVGPRRAFPSWNGVVDAMVLGSQFHVCPEERQSDGIEGERLYCVWSSQDRQCAVQQTQSGLDCRGMAGGSWATGELLSLVPKGYNISSKAQDVSKAPT